MTTENLQNSLTRAVEKLDKITVVCLSMSIWSGAKTISESEIEAAGGAALPNSIANLGSKKVVNPDDLAPFSKIRTRTYRYLRANGVNFCKGAVAIPLDKSDEILKGLDSLIEEFDRCKDEFLASYDDKLQQWIDQNPAYEELIRNGALSKSEVESRFGASLHTLQVQNVRERDRARNVKLAEDLGSRLLDEVSTDAEKYCVSIVTKETISRRGISVVEKFREKLSSLSFLTDKIIPVVSLLDGVLSRIPEKGDLEGEIAGDFKAAVTILANRRLLQQFIDGLITFESQRTTFFGLSSAFAGGKTSQPTSANAPAPQDAETDLFATVESSDVHSEQKEDLVAQPVNQETKKEPLASFFF